MIGLRDATMLALTKLRTRKVRLTVTIAVSGLLFAGLAGASFVARGIMNGFNDFGKEGLGSRYIAEVYPQIDFSFMNNTEILDRAIAIQKDTVARKKAEAKRLGIDYRESNEQPPFNEYSLPDGTKQKSLDLQQPASMQAINEYLAKHPLPGQDTLKKTAATYQPQAFFTAKSLPYNLQGAQLQVLKDGKENFEQTSMKGGMPTNGTESFVSSWTSMSRDLLQPFILPGQNLAVGADGSIPVLAPQTAAEQILKLKALPSSATSADRLDRTKEIRTKAPGVTFNVCYRNSTSSSLVQQAVSTQQEIERNKNKKDYQKPSLIYGLPAEACGSVPVTRDVRSATEKTLASKQEQFDRTFGTPAPEQTTLQFRIVGIMPDVDYGGGPAFSIGQIIRGLVASSLGGGWFSPSEAVAGNQLLSTLFSASDASSMFGNPERMFVEFNSAASTRGFIEKENCTPDYSKATPDSNFSIANYCTEQGKSPFGINPFGSNSLALESAKKGFGKFFRLAALAVCAIAAVIMMGTVGRMIADSRRETAVFRAIGAKKLDIAEIYVIYSICLSLLIALFAIVVGLLLALFANHRWSPEATLQALTAYNARDLTKTFSLYAWYLPDLLTLVGLSLAAGLLSAVFPLLRNLRRNPIRDMRDDT